MVPCGGSSSVPRTTSGGASLSVPASIYEQNKLNFAGQGNILQTDQKTPVTDAQDEYMGIMFTVGYAYRPFIR